jgi:Flp pilus assembly pilin Flp
MLHRLVNFLNDEDGAVTVDWVVLSAAVIGLGMVVLSPVAFSANSSTQGIADYLKSISVGYDAH